MIRIMGMASISLLSIVWADVAFAQAANQNSQAAAQKNAQSTDVSSTDIIVTATKVATNVQAVPIAITAISADTLQDRQLKTTADLGAIVPNATFRKEEGIYGSGVSVTLRGLGQTDTQFSGEPAVAYYIDDVYYPFLFGSNFDLLDLDHVEVLRGPQGTLFGRNAISGAINMVSKKPSLTDASGYIDLTVGAYARRDLRAGLSIPLTHNLAISASMVSKKTQGYMKELDFSCQMYKNGTPELAGTFPFQTPGTSWATGKRPNNCVIGHYGGEDQRAGRIAVRWQPRHNIELNLSADYTHSTDDVAAEKVFYTDYGATYGLQPDGTVDESKANPNFITMADQFSIPGTPFRWDKRFETGSMYSTYDNFCDPFPVGTKIPGNSYYNGSLFRGGICHGTTVPLTSWGVQGKLVVGLTDQIDVSAIAGYRKMDTFFGAAWDGTIFNDSLIYHEDHTWNWNGELRLTGKHDWIDWNAGLFYYKGYASENGEPQNVRVGTQQYQYVYYHPEAKAAYLNVTVRPFSRLSFNGGVRRSDDKKFVDYAALQDASAPGSTTFKPSGTSTIFTLPIRNKRWDWKLGANYDFSEHGMVYVSAATGYRLPTFNTRVFQNGQAEQNSDEALTNYEVGVKVDLFDRKLRINADAFLIKFQERPASFGGMEPRFASDGVTVLPGNQTLIPDGPANSAFAQSFTNCRNYNAATDGPQNIAQGVGITCVSRSFAYTVTGSNFKGLEAEVTLTPIRNLVITGSMGYTDRGSDTGRPLNFPDWTASGGIQYTIDADFLGGTITPRLDWFYASSIAYNTNTPEYDQPANSTFNGRISYRNREYDFDLSVGATNLFNKKYYLQKTIFTAIGAEANIGQPAAPREWYLNLTKRF